MKSVSQLQDVYKRQAYVYPLSKRTAVKAYAGYGDSSKAWKDTEQVVYNGYQVYFGLRHSF